MKTSNKKISNKKRVLSRLIFGRTPIIIILLIIQLFILVSTVNWLSNYSTLVYGFWLALAAVVVIKILNDDSNSSFKMAWIIPVLLIPVFGAFFYVYVVIQPETKNVRKRLTAIEMQLKKCDDQNQQVLAHLKAEAGGEYNLSRYLHNIGNYCVYEDNSIEFFPLGEDKYAEMLKQIKNAKKFIFLEYFIVCEGTMLRTILSLLTEKVQEGVEVRFMYDGMCSLVQVPFGYWKQLRQNGIDARVFSQIRPVLSTVQNNRDHRKILIIDGETVFTGGINIADEYINKLNRFGHWKDTAVMIKGDAVNCFTYMFLEMWHVSGKESSIPQKDLERYIIKSNRKDDLKSYDRQNTLIKNARYIMPYADNPFSSDRICKQVYLDILNRASKYVHIMTPYLILDDEMIAALSYCAKRGVETIIIMPHIPDKVYAYLLARTYYRQLISNGVAIYEYMPGFVHAKEFISDDIRATVGTSNLDFRSLYLHFECGAYIYGSQIVCDIEKDFLFTLEKCHRITLKDCKEYPGYKKATGELLRLIAPLM